MLKRWTWLALILVALLAFVGCSDDDPVAPVAGPTAFEVMAAAGAAYLNGPDAPGIIGATVLSDNLELYTVVDIRSKAVYDAGHIPGAYNSSLATILDDVGTTIPTDKTIVICCYSGQSAGHAKIALSLSGYDDVFSLGFGMSSWHSSLASVWDGKIGNTLTNPEQTNNNGDLTTHDFPVLTEDPETVVAERVAGMLAAGLPGKMYVDIMDNLDQYFILNYFGEADYLGEGIAGVPGHIPGAFQFTPKSSMAMDQMLNKLPTDLPIVVYCWTSQHSSQVTAYLNMLGYEAYSLKFGSNNLFHDLLTDHEWNGAEGDFALEVTPVSALAVTLVN